MKQTETIELPINLKERIEALEEELKKTTLTLLNYPHLLHYVTLRKEYSR